MNVQSAGWEVDSVAIAEKSHHEEGASESTITAAVTKNAPEFSSTFSSAAINAWVEPLDLNSEEYHL